MPAHHSVFVIFAIAVFFETRVVACPRQPQDSVAEASRSLTVSGAWTWGAFFKVGSTTVEPLKDRTFIAVELLSLAKREISFSVSDIVLTDSSDARYLPLAGGAFDGSTIEMFSRKERGSGYAVMTKGSVSSRHMQRVGDGFVAAETVTISRKDENQPVEFTMMGARPKVILLFEVPVGAGGFRVSICGSRPAAIEIRPK
jgi:hypothetical protein